MRKKSTEIFLLEKSLFPPFLLLECLSPSAARSPAITTETFSSSYMTGTFRGGGKRCVKDRRPTVAAINQPAEAQDGSAPNPPLQIKENPLQNPIKSGAGFPSEGKEGRGGGRVCSRKGKLIFLSLSFLTRMFYVRNMEGGGRGGGEYWKEEGRKILVMISFPRPCIYVLTDT